MIALASSKVGARSFKIIAKEVHESEFCKALLTKYDASIAMIPERKDQISISNMFHRICRYEAFLKGCAQ